ncbi:hypothetical protein IX317_000075 [Fusobacterium sp. DD29]|uniref:adhesion protein FadA n=1 Tax=unclassified Fusobacterium TaxID=2648384 RepID=UPI001B8C5F9F|nr:MULTISPECIES: adhesion protein FadA [unclassified Fusobacterium]MBR8700286.1 hypothetical protein [Fusobacterium sp. DD45]MBR8709979.1 hypothetical protein [Fusobacterium sp. DD28]MBR8748416.1 hypothetical protein [Fusobacterium sp. DD29]MBR8750621.1 hypothetical protein [Fusobacterium sp. DD26]MBR8760683.1 hypothetical protein [Fusobacterium sp. DD25]
MKKVLVVLFATLLVSQVYASQDIMAEFQDLDAQYQQLVNEENARFEEEKVNCQLAEQKIVQLNEAIATVKEKIADASIERESRYFKDDFDALTKKYKEYLGKLEQSLAVNEGIVADFQKISAVRGNQN